MKQLILILTLTLATLSAEASKLSVTLKDGQSATLSADACVDPATGRLGPCLIARTAASADQDACYNASTGRLEPCLSAARAGVDQDACYDPVTGRWEPCY